MTKKEKLMALSSMMPAMLVVAFFACTLRPYLLESWLICKLDSKGLEERTTAAEELGEIGSLRALLPLWSLYQRDGGTCLLPFDPDVEAARESMGRIAKRSIPALIQALEEPLAKLHPLAPVFLGMAGEEAAAGIPALASALRGRELKLRVRAAHALYRVGGPKAVSALLLALKDREASVRVAAAQGCEVPFLDDRALEDAFIELLGDPDDGVKLVALHVVQTNGLAKKAGALSFLEPLLHHVNPEVRRRASELLDIPPLSK